MSNCQQVKMKMYQHIEEILISYKDVLGKEYIPYRNHVHRVSIITMRLKKTVKEEDEDKIAIAAAYHDLGIWTEKTFDYLEPSIELANEYLVRHDLIHWSDEITLIIDLHHKRTVYKGKYADNVESFREADLIDITGGRINFNISRDFIKENYERYPFAGFRGLLLKKFLKNLLQNPLNPLPMFKK